MGLDSKLQNEGSIYAYNATNLLPTTGFGAPGENTPQSILATINSPLHAYESQQDPFVSRDLGVGDAAFNTTIQNEYNKYLTRLPGTTLNLIPESSHLDLSGTPPLSNTHGTMETTTQVLPYLNNLPI